MCASTFCLRADSWDRCTRAHPALLSTYAPRDASPDCLDPSARARHVCGCAGGRRRRIGSSRAAARLPASRCSSVTMPLVGFTNGAGVRRRVVGLFEIG
jgi:hypothetical protein